MELCDQLIDDIRGFRNSEADKVALGNTSADVYETAIRVSLGMADASWKKREYREKAFYYADKSKSSVLLASIADANANGFGWVIDDFYIQDVALSSEKNLSSKITISPNPVESIATIQLGDLTPGRIEIIDLNGRVLQSIVPKSGSREIQWNRGN